MDKYILRMVVQSAQIITTTLLGIVTAFALSFIASSSMALAYASQSCMGGECANAYSQIATVVSQSIQNIELLAFVLLGINLITLALSMLMRLSITKQWLITIVMLTVVLLLITVNAQALYIHLILGE